MLLVLSLFTVYLNGAQVHPSISKKWKVKLECLRCKQTKYGQTLNNMMSTFLDAGHLVSEVMRFFSSSYWVLNKQANDNVACTSGYTETNKNEWKCISNKKK